MYDPVSFNFDMACQAMLRYNAAKDVDTDAAWNTYYREMRTTYNPHTIWKDDYFIDGCVCMATETLRPDGTRFTGPYGGVSPSSMINPTVAAAQRRAVAFTSGGGAQTMMHDVEFFGPGYFALLFVSSAPPQKA